MFNTLIDTKKKPTCVSVNKYFPLLELELSKCQYRFYLKRTKGVVQYTSIPVVNKSFSDTKNWISHQYCSSSAQISRALLPLSVCWHCGPVMQWFSSGSGPSSSSAASSQPSLLAEWNSYAAARSAEDDAGDGFGIDIEAAVRSANDRVAGTFGM